MTTEDFDPIPLIEAAALIIRAEGNSCDDTEAQIAYVVRATFQKAEAQERIIRERLAQQRLH